MPAPDKSRDGGFGARLGRVFLGPASSFRNANRNWIYFGFIAVVVLILALRGRF